MKIIGLCGQSGAGKTTALDTLSSLGVAICDCDKVSREVMTKGSPCTRELISVFGERIASLDGEINRRALAEIVFFDKTSLERLTEITHRYIKARVFELIDEKRESGEKAFVIDAPLLFESGLDKICDVTLVITAPLEKRVERIMARDGISRELAEKRLSSQLPEEELTRLADEVIVNDKSLNELAESVLDFAERRGIKE